MKNYKRQTKTGAGKPFGKKSFDGAEPGKSRFGGRDFGDNGNGDRQYGTPYSGRSKMYRATCSECGDSCEVPFKPFGNRPVLCNNCFKDAGNVSPGRPGDRDQRSRFQDKGSFRDKKPYAAEAGSGNGHKSADDLKKQFSILNSKLDRILEVLESIVEEVEIEDEDE